jgi:hypothetical protein
MGGGPFPSPAKHYQLVIEDARSLGQRREHINDMFLGVLTLALGAQAYLFITYKDDDIRSTLLIVVIGLFSTRLCSIWGKVLANYAALLRFRYIVLKTWETEMFPPDQRYYLAEDIVYDQRLSVRSRKARHGDRDTAPSTDSLLPLAKAYIKQLKGFIPDFVNVYELLPRLAFIVSLGIVGVRVVFFMGSLLTTDLPHLHFLG